MTDKVPERKTTRVRVSSRALPKGPVIELSAQGDFGEPIDRARLDEFLGHIDDLRPVGRNDGEWISRDGRLRVLVGDERALIRFEMRDESDDLLARHIDRTFDLALDLARELSLDLTDSDLGSITRYRYEREFTRILDLYRSRARTAFALEKKDAWRELSRDSEPIVLPALVHCIEAEPETLPAVVWSQRVRKVGPLELNGEQAAAVVAGVSPECPWFGIVRPRSAGGDDVALLRITRLSNVEPGRVIVEAIAAGLTRSLAIERDAASIRATFERST